MTERLSDEELLDLCGKWATEDATKMRRPSAERVALTELVERRQQDAWRPIAEAPTAAPQLLEALRRSADVITTGRIVARQHGDSDWASACERTEKEIRAAISLATEEKP